MSSIPQQMHAVRAPDPGGPEALRRQTVATPQPGPGEVLIEVAAAGVNGPDLLQRQGLYPPPPGASDVLGLEVSGHVAAIGPEVDPALLNEPRCALIPGGGYAEYAVARADALMTIPHGVTLIDAAGLPETLLTVWANVFERGRLQPGETLLVHGGAGGIGATAIQMAAAHGARVLATARGAEKRAFCEALGAARAIDPESEDFVAIVRELGGADVVLDMVGGDYVQRNISALNADGRLVQIAFLAGSHASVDLLPLMLKRLTLTGSTLRARPAEEKARLARALTDAAWPWFATGRMRATTHQTFALTDAAAAHAMMEARTHLGKLLLTP